MTNEFGAKLDRNRYAPSILNTTEGICWQCLKHTATERHEVFGGALRYKSKEYGLWIDLCAACHRTSPIAAHQSAKTANIMKVYAQEAAIAHYDWTMEDWQRRFYKNYIGEDDQNV